MQTNAHPTYPTRGDQIRFYLVYVATYPLFLAAETVQRLVARASAQGPPRIDAQGSVFAAARESAFIAIAYVLMARTTLQTFARQNRTERLS
jgi:hypothetical protein